jgi:DNA-3-methyladenine glycosylase
VSATRRPRPGAQPRTRLGADFFDRSVQAVARELIGCRLLYDGVGGTIVETESYERDDPACHAYVGLTARTAVIFGPPGRAYVYLSYGIHSLLNFVCGPDGEPAAVLVRALEPTDGLEAMRERRGPRHADTELCNGPGKLTEALGITLADNDTDLSRPPFEILPADGDLPEVVTSPRVGITKAVEFPWRFSAAGSRFVSRPRP